MSLLEKFLKNAKINYNCSYKSLRILSKNIPKKIGGDFSCKGNKLISLEGSPKIVTGNYDCSENYLTTLKYCPEEINGYFDCSNNKLKSLEHRPKFIKGIFDCSGNYDLKNIKEQIIKYQIKAVRYLTDDFIDEISNNFDFKDIKEEFENYGNYLLKEKEKKLEKEKIKQNIKTNKIKLNKNDYGLGI